MNEKTCSECKFFKLNMQQYPCCNCINGSKWERFDSTTQERRREGMSEKQMELIDTLSNWQHMIGFVEGVVETIDSKAGISAADNLSELSGQIHSFFMELIEKEQEDA